MPRPLKILVTDDDPVNAMLVEAVARQMGHAALLAGSGEQAVALFRSESPDLVFMDIMMPGMDGIDAVRQIRAQPRQRWVPIVFLSALDSAEDMVRGLQTGGDDYLTKPASVQVLRAKIESYARLIRLQEELLQHTDELLAWRAQAEEQNQLGDYVISRLVDAEGLRDPLVRWRNIPAQTFSGDLVCAARAPGDVLYLMLADAAGHGLPAALTALPLTQVFYGMTAKGFPVPSIAEELNRKLKAFLPIDRFVATTLVAVDTRNQTVEVWNGGNPEILLVAGNGELDMRWSSAHLPLGILPPDAFSGTTETFNYLRAGELVLCSDGVVEAESPDGTRLTQAAVEQILRGAPAGRRYEALDQGLHRHLGDRQDHDDISWMVVDVPLAQELEVRPIQAGSAGGDLLSEWAMELTWGAAELRHVDVVPAVLTVIGQVQSLAPHRSALFVIISELFNNALDHGLLRLDSAGKTLAGGIEAYLEERARRLAALAEGRIVMGFQLRTGNGRPSLEIRLGDSGPGFDFLPYLAAQGGAPTANLHGRGIQLVRALCSELRYAGNGNQVYARYLL